jgi:hypothetical protein
MDHPMFCREFIIKCQQPGRHCPSLRPVCLAQFGTVAHRSEEGEAWRCAWLTCCRSTSACRAWRRCCRRRPSRSGCAGSCPPPCTRHNVSIGSSTLLDHHHHHHHHPCPHPHHIIIIKLISSSSTTTTIMVLIVSSNRDSQEVLVEWLHVGVLVLVLVLQGGGAVVPRDGRLGVDRLLHVL